MQTSSVPINSNEVRADYKSKVRAFKADISKCKSQQFRYLATSLLCTAAGVLGFLAAFKASGTLFAIPPILLLGAFLQFRKVLSCRARMLDLALRSSFYERGIDRLEDNWRGKGRTGLEFARDQHLYQADLDILGEGSLFELLATTRSEVGAERLAAYLLDTPSVDEARARQAAVKELQTATRLREDIAILGNYQFQNCRSEHLRAWLDQRILTPHWIVPVFLLFSGTACLLLGLCGYSTIFPWLRIIPIFFSILLVQGAICFALMHQVRSRVKVLMTLAGDVVVLRQGIECIESRFFQSAKLRRLVEHLQSKSAAATVRRLERLLIGLNRLDDPILYGFSLWLAARTQLVLAIERWRARHKDDFEDWLDAWSEFETLNALACYSWEHPRHAFPELLEGSAGFEAEELGHPLLPIDRCVSNDVMLNASRAFYLVSGSNMAGKSTFLRAIGLNAVLGLAGAPVCATSARLAVFRVCASISITDSLEEGKSKFLAEVERLRESIRATDKGNQVLFLVDEILSGTNSKDRRIAAEAMIVALVAGGAVGALSTHDLALTEIADKPELHGQNVHMESASREDPLAFDYRVKPGISRQTNALAIVRMLGIPIA